jgi:hypothetical protein
MRRRLLQRTSENALKSSSGTFSWLYSRTSWKGYSANFALTEFWEVRGWE